MNPLVLLALQQTPAIVGMIRSSFVKANPDTPPPSDAEIFAALELSFRSSLARDEDWLAARPDEENGA